MVFDFFVDSCAFSNELPHFPDVERIFPMSSPHIDSIVVEKRGRVRRAKLYYLRNLTGKAARIREKVVSSAK